MLRPALALALAVPTAVLAAGPASANSPTCWGHPATIVGTSGDDELTGTPGPDVIAGLGGDDELDGRGGDDLICGGPGADVLLGGSGDDELHDGLDGREQRGRRTFVTGDLLDGGPGDDVIKPQTDYAGRRTLVTRPDTVSYADSPRPVRVDLRDNTAHGYGDDRVFHDHDVEVDGSRYDDVLLGSGDDEILDGGRGDDTLDGRNGRDAVVDQHGDDVLDGGRGADFVISTTGVDTVDGGDGQDFMIASSWSSSTVQGGAGDDFITRWFTTGPVGELDGGPGSNELEVEAQIQPDDGDLTGELDRAAGTATLRWDDRTQVTRFSNMDFFILDDADWTFRGTDEADFVQVLSGALDAQTFGGDDTMFGDDQDDTLDGGDGTDAAWGAGGHNTCVDTEQGDCDGRPTFRRQAPVGHRDVDQLVREWISR